MRKTALMITLAFLITLGAVSVVLMLPRPVASAGLVQLTSSHDNDIEPQFSPDGKWIAFSSDRRGSFDIWTVDSLGRKLTQLTSLATDEFNPKWSPSGSSIAFLAVSGGESDLCVYDIRSGSLANVSRGVGRVGSFDWSRDGGNLAFSSEVAGSWGIYVVGANGGTPVMVTPRDQNSTDPSWTPDGRIVFSLSRRGLHQLAIMNPEGSTIMSLTSGGSDDVMPAVSDEGSLVAFVSNRTVLSISPAGGLTIESRGRYTVWILNLTSGDLRPAVSDPISQTPGLQVAPEACPGEYPVWNSKGHLAMVSVSAERGVMDEDIYAYYRDIQLVGYVGPAAFDLRGDAIVPLVAGVYNETGPTWSPDGKSVVYSSNTDGSYNLRILKLSSETPKPYG